jgi:hypothetical protein
MIQALLYPLVVIGPAGIICAFYFFYWQPRHDKLKGEPPS